MAGAELRQPVEPGPLVAPDGGRFGDDVDGGPEVAHAPAQRRIDGRIAHQHERPAPQPALHRQCQTEGAGGRLDHHRARFEHPVIPGPVEDVPGGEQLHQAEGRAVQVGAEVNDAGQLQRPGDGDGHVPQKSLLPLAKTRRRGT